MNLEIGDYAALAALLIATGVAGFFTNSAQLDAVEARLDGAQKLGFQAASDDRENLRDDFSDLSTTITSLVEQGMKARSNEVLMALTDLSKDQSEVTLKVANMDIDSEVYFKIQEIAGWPGSSVKVVNFGGKAVASVYFKDFEAPDALAVSKILESAKGDAGQTVQVSLALGADYFNYEKVFAEEKIDAEIKRLEAIRQQIKND